jgi:hypothetical protein
VESPRARRARRVDERIDQTIAAARLTQILHQPQEGVFWSFR